MAQAKYKSLTQKLLA